MADNDELENSTDEEIDGANDEQADEQEQEEVELEEQASRRATLNAFKQMRVKYMAKSTLWPFLSPSELKLLNQIKKINPAEYTSFMQLVATRKSAFAAKVNSALAAIVPLLPYIIIGLLVLVGVIVIFSVLMPWLFGLFEGTSGAPFGANGENFYGMRYIYYDAEQARADLWADYAGALNYTIENFEDENVTLNLEMPTSENDGELDLGKLNPTAEDGEYADEYLSVVEIAKAVYLADNAGAESEVLAELDGILAEIKASGFSAELAEKLDANLGKILAGIKYFGFDAEIVEQISQDLAQFIEDNTLYTLKQAEDGSTPSVDVSDTLQPAFSSLLLKEFVTDLQTEEGAPTRTDLLYIKDYILGDDADSTIDGVGQENYVAMIYLPKNNVEIDSVTYSIFGVETADFNVAIYSNGSEVAAKNDSNFGVPDGYEKGEDTAFDTYQFTAENLTLSALTFSEFEKGFLTSEKSLINILRALKASSTNSGLLNKYLAQADETNTAFWADGENVEGGTQGGGSGTSGGESGETDTSETNFYTFNYQTYLAVLAHNSANTQYSFTEFETNVATA